MGEFQIHYGALSAGHDLILIEFRGLGFPGAWFRVGAWREDSCGAHGEVQSGACARGNFKKLTAAVVDVS
jgi:hypothetical protein